MTACTRCGECQKICPTGAIDLKLDARREFRVLVVNDELEIDRSCRAVSGIPHSACMLSCQLRNYLGYCEGPEGKRPFSWPGQR